MCRCWEGLRAETHGFSVDRVQPLLVSLGLRLLQAGEQRLSFSEN